MTSGEENLSSLSGSPLNQVELDEATRELLAIQRNGEDGIQEIHYGWHNGEVIREVVAHGEISAREYFVLPSSPSISPHVDPSGTLQTVQIEVPCHRGNHLPLVLQIPYAPQGESS